MKLHRPSPALVVSIVALVAALTGTAVAAKVLITSSAQVKNGALTGGDLRDGTITARKINAGTLASLKSKNTVTASSVTQTSATESFRKTGPDAPTGGQAIVAKLDLGPGSYAIIAKTIMTPNTTTDGLVDAIAKDNKTVQGRCKLDAAGDVDEAIGNLVSPGSQNPLTLHMQITRTVAEASTVTVSCEAPEAPWHGSDTSIIAIALGGSSRTESTP